MKVGDWRQPLVMPFLRDVAVHSSHGQLTCGSLNTVGVSFQGRLVSTQDVSSVDLLFHLKEWLLTDPVIDLG